MSVKEKRDLKHVSWQTENSVHEFGIKRLFDVLWQEVFVRTYLALPCFRTLRVVSNPVMVRLCVCDSESVEEKGLEGLLGVWVEHTACYPDMWMSGWLRKRSSLQGSDGGVHTDSMMNEGGKLQEAINQYLFFYSLF